MKQKSLSRITLGWLIVISCALLLVAQAAASAGTAGSAKVDTAPGPSNASAGVPGARYLHLATASNTSNFSTFLDHPLANGDPDAIIVVTHNYNPGQTGNIYDNHNIAVMYDVGSTRWAIINQDNANMPVGAAFNVFIASAGSPAFVHTATAGNISGNVTLIDHPLLNGYTDAMGLVTPNINPGAGAGVTNDHPFAMTYFNGAEGQWAIFNQDSALMPEGASFNVLVVTPTPVAGVHIATADTIYSNYSVIDHPLANGNPNAMVHATQNFSPPGGGGIDNSHPIGVWYYSGAQKWAVYNEDQTPMPAGAAFNVFVATSQEAVLTHSATVTNTIGSATMIDHPVLNDDSCAIALVTQNWNPGGAGDTYNNHSISLQYQIGFDQWSVINQDVEVIEPGAAFNLLAPAMNASVFLHTARAWNIDDNWTYLDHPLTNGNPDAIVLVSQNRYPCATGGATNDHAIGLWYHPVEEKWAIFNQDQVAMPEDAAFNVYVATTHPNAFVHTATADNITYNHTCIDHPLSNGNPHAILLVSQNWNPGGGATGVYNDQNIGVWYKVEDHSWCIFIQDQTADMPEGADFNVLVIGAKVHLPLVLRRA